MSPEPLRVALFGLGGVGRAVLELLAERAAPVEIVAAADSGGAVVGPVAPAELLAAKRSGKLPTSPVPVDEVIRSSGADAVVDVASCDFWSGEPSRSILVAALERGLPAVTANKAPLARGWEELAKRSAGPAAVRYSAAAGAALPAVAVARSLARIDAIQRVEGVLTGTATFVLTRMAEGIALEAAVAQAQAAGIAEPDPSIDVGGWDTAAKLVILANTVWPDANLTLDAVAVRGVEAGLPEEARPAGIAESARPGPVRLVAHAARTADGIEARVAPRRLPPDHPLAVLQGRDKGVVFEGPEVGRVVVTGGRSHPRGAAAAVLGDLLEIAGARS